MDKELYFGVDVSKKMGKIFACQNLYGRIYAGRTEDKGLLHGCLQDSYGGRILQQVCLHCNTRSLLHIRTEII